MPQATTAASAQPPFAKPVIPDVRRPSELASPVPQDQKPTLASARQLTHDRHYDEALPRLDAFLAVEPENTEAQLLNRPLNFPLTPSATEL